MGKRVRVVFHNGKKVIFPNAVIMVNKRVVIQYKTTETSHTVYRVIPFEAIRVAEYV